MKNNDTKGSIVPVSSLIMVASVMFGSHAGSGFASGNQADKYFIQAGWIGIFTPFLAIAIMALINREAIAMYNNHNCKDYRDLFRYLYHPYDKLSILFEIYFNLMVLVGASSVLAGAAELLKETGFMSYVSALLLVGTILLLLTAFGEKVVAKASTFFSVIIIVTCLTIFIAAISKKGIPDIVNTAISLGTPKGLIKPILSAFAYAGFCSSVIPALTKTGTLLKTRKDAGKSMLIAFFMNVIPLFLSVFMLFAWCNDYNAAGKSTLPTLFITQQLGSDLLFVFYYICLMLCLISTGVTVTYGFVSRFEDVLFLKNRIKNKTQRCLIVAFFALALSTIFSLVGLDNVINYGYRYMGYFATVTFIIPLLTIGRYKNKKSEKLTKNGEHQL